MRHPSLMGLIIIISFSNLYGTSNNNLLALSVGGSNLRRGITNDSIIIGNDEYSVLNTGISNLQQAIPIIERGRNLAVSGNILFFSSLLVEEIVLNPWGERILTKLAHDSTHQDSANSMGDELLFIGTSLPVSALGIAAASMACAGASRSYGAYHDGIDPSIKDIQVWKPYVIGWALGAASTVSGFLGGLGNSSSMQRISSILGIGADISWSVSSVWSLVYAAKAQHQSVDKRKVHLIPFSASGYGFTLKIDY